MSLKFRKNKEDFRCEKCDFLVSGNGYTNHCPKCLWSKHVDVFPGDRESHCGGLMRPIGLVKKGENFVINHQCVSCGYEKNNKTSPEDDVGRFLTDMLK